MATPTLPFILAAGDAGGATWYQPLVDSLYELWETAVQLVPRLITAVVIVAVGYLVSRIVSKTFSKLLEKIGMDGICERLGIKEMMDRAGLKKPFSEILGKLLFWGLMLVFIQVATRALGFIELTVIVTGIIAYLPKVIVATLIMMVGYLVADIVRNVVGRKLESLGLEYAGTLTAIIFGFLLVLIGTVAVSQLGIDIQLINRTVEIALISFGLAVALALGLGLRGLAHSVVSGVYARDFFTPGTIVVYEDKEMKVVAVGPVTTRLEDDKGNFASVPNSRLMTEVVHGKMR